MIVLKKGIIAPVIFVLVTFLSPMAMSDSYKYVAGNQPSNVPNYDRYLTSYSKIIRDIDSSDINIPFTDSFNYQKMLDMSFESLSPGTHSVNEIKSKSGWKIQFDTAQSAAPPSCPPNVPYCNIPLSNRPGNKIMSSPSSSTSNLYSLEIIYDDIYAPLAEKYLRISISEDDDTKILSINLINNVKAGEYLKWFKGYYVKVTLAVKIDDLGSDYLNSAEVKIDLYIKDDSGYTLSYNYTDAIIDVTDNWIHLPAYVCVPQSDNIENLTISVEIKASDRPYLDDAVIDFDLSSIATIQSVIRPIIIKLSTNNLTMWLPDSLSSESQDFEWCTKIPGDYRTALGNLLDKVRAKVSSSKQDSASQWELKYGYVVITRTILPPHRAQEGNYYYLYTTIDTSLTVITFANTEVIGGQKIGYINVLSSDYITKNMRNYRSEYVRPMLRLDYPAIEKVQIHGYGTEYYPYNIRVKWGLNNEDPSMYSHNRFKTRVYEGNASIINSQLLDDNTAGDAVSSAIDAINTFALITGEASFILMFVLGGQGISVALAIMSFTATNLGLYLQVVQPSSTEVLNRFITYDDSFYSLGDEPATADALFDLPVNTGDIKGWDRIAYVIYSYLPAEDYIEISYDSYVSSSSYDKFLYSLTTYSWTHAVFFKLGLLNETYYGENFEMSVEDVNLTMISYLAVVERSAYDDNYIGLNGYEMVATYFVQQTAIEGIDLTG